MKKKLTNDICDLGVTMIHSFFFLMTILDRERRKTAKLAAKCVIELQQLHNKYVN
jgi:hypothetical protein